MSPACTVTRIMAESHALSPEEVELLVGVGHVALKADALVEGEEGGETVFG